jgi:hypothetical protein
LVGDNPEFSTVPKIIKALKIKLRVAPVGEEKHARWREKSCPGNARLPDAGFLGGFR